MTTGAPDPHDHLVRYVFGRPEAIAIVLRRVLPASLIAVLDLAALRLVASTHTNARLRVRESDLCFMVDALEGERRVPVVLAIEHQSTRDPRMPWRALVYAGELWDRYIREHPRRARKLPLILPILLTQHSGRNTPVQLSQILDVPPGLRRVLGAPIELVLYTDDFSGSILMDRKAPPATRALVEVSRALLHAHEDPTVPTRRRIATLARQVDVLLEHDQLDDIGALWIYVITAFEAESKLCDMLMRSVSKPAREVYMTIAEELLARGQRIGEQRGQRIGQQIGRRLGLARGKAEALLGVLEHRALPISGTIRRRVLATRNEAKLQRWFDRAFTVASAEELFDPST